MKIYLDNAATTPIDPTVVQAMLPVLENNYGNPSSIHSLGRESRVIIEQSRKKVASFINAAPSEIFFTAGGTEADNMVLRSAVSDLAVNHIITSPIEHHAVIDTAEYLGEGDQVKLSLVKHDQKGYVDMAYLEQLLAENKDKTTLVSLMHANNEIGNKISLEKVNALCKKYGAYFHSDTVNRCCSCVI